MLKFAVFAAIVALAHGHGYLKEPIARTSIQLRPEFNTQQPYWWDNQGVWCANVQQDLQYSQCGRCGEPIGDSSASQGGMYDKGVIVATYQSGSVIDVVAEYTGAHYGHFEVELCPSAQETNGCFQKLPVVESTYGTKDGTKACTPYDNDIPGPVTAKVWLPAGVTCERCTIRWTHRTSYPGRPDWDACDNPYNTQTFRNCADVRIV